MQDLASFLNDNAGAIQAFFAIVVGISTVVTVLLSGFMWREMRYTNQRLEQPNVQAVLQPGRRWGHIWDLVLRNQGGVPVYDVRIDVSPKDLPGLTHDVLTQAELFKRPLPVLLEGQEVRTVFLDYTDIANIETGLPTITITASYKTAYGKVSTQRFSYDTGAYYGLMEMEEKTLADVTKQIEGVAKQMKDAVAATKEANMYMSWMPMLQGQQLRPDASLREVFASFITTWTDFTTAIEIEGAPYVRGLGSFKVRKLCQDVYDRVARTDEPNGAYQELRVKLFEMAAFPRLLTAHLEERFLSLGNEAVDIMRRGVPAEQAKDELT